MPSHFACNPTEEDLIRACAPEQPAAVEVGQRWLNIESGEIYPVRSVRDDIIAPRDGSLVRLGSDSYAILVSERDLRDRYVCTDPPDNVTAIR